MGGQNYELLIRGLLLSDDLLKQTNEVLLDDLEAFPSDLLARHLEVGLKCLEHSLDVLHLLLLDHNAFGIKKLFVQIQQRHVLFFVCGFAAPVNQRGTLHKRENLRTLWWCQDGSHCVEELGQKRESG